MIQSCHTRWNVEPEELQAVEEWVHKVYLLFNISNRSYYQQACHQIHDILLFLI